MLIERQMNDVLRHIPALRVAAKRAYQFTCWALSPKERATTGVVRVTPEDGEHLFGYYDKSPWDASGRRMLTMRVPAAHRHPRPGEVAEIRLIDGDNRSTVRTVAVTRAWNLQQGCMLQWLGPDFSRRIIYNDFRNGAYCSVIFDVTTSREEVQPLPVYAVSVDGSQALSLDFARLHRMRPGYGYCNTRDLTEGQLCPDSPCIWRVDLVRGTVAPILRYTDLALFQPRSDMRGAEHKVNHLMIAPSGKRFMVLHRWRTGKTVRSRYTRLLTADMDGANLWNLLDADMVSHCCFRDDDHILAWGRKHGVGDAYIMLTDRTHDAEVQCEGILMSDGHPSYSPDRAYIVTDSYPDRKRIARVFVVRAASGDVREAARVFAPFRYDNETRCDLHPRWNFDGTRICFDAAFEGNRQSYTIANPFHSDACREGPCAQLTLCRRGL